MCETERVDIFKVSPSTFLGQRRQRKMCIRDSIALVLAALVEERHDDVDPARFSANGCDDALQILKMIVRRHVVRIFSNGVGQAVVADIYEQIEIRAADRIFDDTFCLSGSKTRNTGIYQIGVCRLYTSTCCWYCRRFWLPCWPGVF